MKIEQSNATLGAYVYDVDLKSLDENDFSSIEQAWYKYAVLVFPGQFLDDDSHVNFSKRFGNLERQGIASGESFRPEIYLTSNQHTKGVLDAADDAHSKMNHGNQFWHTDSSYKSVSAKASLLRAETVPSTGGQTEFADMRAGYDALDSRRKEELTNALAVHSFEYSQSTIGGLELLTEQELEDLPPVEHPIVNIHPETGRPSLYIGRHASHIIGRDIIKGRNILRVICNEACKVPRLFSHTWSVGDLVLWDNRCVLHRGRPWPSDQLRVMYRTTVAGDENDNKWALHA